MSVFTLLSDSALDEIALVCEIFNDLVEDSDDVVAEPSEPSTGDSRDLRSGVNLPVIDDLPSAMESTIFYAFLFLIHFQEIVFLNSNEFQKNI